MLYRPIDDRQLLLQQAGVVLVRLTFVVLILGLIAAFGLLGTWVAVEHLIPE